MRPAYLLAPKPLTMIFHDVMALVHERRPILLIPTADKHPENEIDAKPLLSLILGCAMVPVKGHGRFHRPSTSGT